MVLLTNTTKEKKEFIVAGMPKEKNMDTELIMRARELAFAYHKNQKYGSNPYSYHLQNVVNQVRIYSSLISKESLEDAICVAYLHDILEDTLCTQDEILRALNPRILLAVKLLTKNGLNFESYFNQIAKDDLAIFVKLCDRYCNILESINNINKDKLAKYKKQNPKFIEILFNKNYIELLKEIEFLFNYN